MASGVININANEKRRERLNTDTYTSKSNHDEQRTTVAMTHFETPNAHTEGTLYNGT